MTLLAMIGGTVHGALYSPLSWLLILVTLALGASRWSWYWVPVAVSIAVTIQIALNASWWEEANLDAAQLVPRIAVALTIIGALAYAAGRAVRAIARNQ